LASASVGHIQRPLRQTDRPKRSERGHREPVASTRVPPARCNKHPREPLSALKYQVRQSLPGTINWGDDGSHDWVEYSPHRAAKRLPHRAFAYEVNCQVGRHHHARRRTRETSHVSLAAWLPPDSVSSSAACARTLSITCAHCRDCGLRGARREPYWISGLQPVRQVYRQPGW